MEQDASHTRTRTNRRQFLRTLGGVTAAAGLASTAGCLDLLLGPQGGGGGFNAGSIPEGSNVPTAVDPQRYAGKFSEVVNAVRDLNADPTGEQPIDGILNSTLNSDTLLFLPEGTYKMNSGFRSTGASHNIGIVGNNAVIRHGRVDAISGHRVTEGEFRGGTRLFRFGTPNSPHSGDVVMGGLIFDWSWHENAGMQGLNLHTTGHAEIENIRFHGLHSLGTHGSIRAATLANDSSAIFRNIAMPQGGLHWHRTINDRNTDQRYGPNRPGPSWSTSGFTIGSEQRGTMLLENVSTGPWPDNGLYLKGGTSSNPTGRKILRGCVAHNCNVSNIRVNSDGDWEPVDRIDGYLGEGYDQTVVENCRVVLNGTPDELTFGAQHGIRLDDGDPIVRNCEVVVAHGNGHGIRVNSGTNGARVLNTNIDVHVPELALSVASSSATVQGTVVNLHGDISPSRVLSGVSEGAGIAVQRAQAQSEPQS